MDLQLQLDELCLFLQRTQDFKYFSTEHARKLKSDARRLVESGESIFKIFDRKQMSKILLLAIYLGGSTLKKYKNVLVDEGNKKLEFVKDALTKLLITNFGFDQNYAVWLPKNL